MAGILDRINQPNDIKKISPAQYNRLAKEIRSFLLHRVSEHGGHLASNLGAAFPITPGEHFDIYHNGRLIYVYPQPNMNDSVKWVCFLDNLMQKKRNNEI